MGVEPGEETRPTFVGVSRAEGEVPPTLNEALESAALKAIAHNRDVDPDRGIKPGETAWFDVSFIRVELGNQHPRTYTVGVTQKPGGGGS